MLSSISVVSDCWSWWSEDSISRIQKCLRCTNFIAPAPVVILCSESRDRAHRPTMEYHHDWNSFAFIEIRVRRQWITDKAVVCTELCAVAKNEFSIWLKISWNDYFHTFQNLASIPLVQRKLSLSALPIDPLSCRYVLSPLELPHFTLKFHPLKPVIKSLLIVKSLW